VTWEGRLSWHRAAELFTAATKTLGPTGHGCTPRDLRTAGKIGTPTARPATAETVRPPPARTSRTAT